MPIALALALVVGVIAGITSAAQSQATRAMTAIDTSEISVIEGDPVVPDETDEETQSAEAIKPKQRPPLPPGTMTLLWTLLTIGLLAIWVVSYAVAVQ